MDCHVSHCQLPLTAGGGGDTSLWSGPGQAMHTAQCIHEGIAIPLRLLCNCMTTEVVCSYACSHSCLVQLGNLPFRLQSECIKETMGQKLELRSKEKKQRAMKNTIHVRQTLGWVRSLLWVTLATFILSHTKIKINLHTYFHFKMSVTTLLFA